MQDISLFWQLTIKTIDDLKIIGNENLMLEMYIMQLTHLKNIDDRKVVLPSDNTSNKILEDNLIGKKNEDKLIENNAPNQIKNQLKSIDQIKTNPIKNLIKENQSAKIEIKSFKDLIDKANKEKEI
jgi:hypothetical protein